MRRSIHGRRISILALCLALAAGGLACGGERDPAPPASQASPTAPPPAASPATGAAKPGAAGLPQDVLGYPGAKVVELIDNAAAGVSASFETTDAPDRVASFYAESLEKRGWIVQKADSPDGPAVFADKEGRSLTVIATVVGDKTEIEMLIVKLQ